MPIYLYQREDGTTFEKMQKVSDAPLTSCPETGQKVKKLLSPPALQFKGSGFYKTDYSSNGASASSNGDSSDSSSSESKSESTGSDSSSSSTASCDGSGSCASCSSDSS